MSIRAVLFDKDGTLVDFHLTWMPPYRAAAEALAADAGDGALADRLMAIGGYDASSGRFVPDSVLASDTNLGIARAWLPHLVSAGLALEERALYERLGEIFAATLVPTPVDGLAAVLERLAGHGLPLGVATMDTEGSARASLAKLDIAHHFDFVCGGDSGHGVKPEPGMVHAFARATGIAEGDIAVIGDSPRDLRMARSAGAGLVVGVLTGTSGAETLSPLADHVLDSIATLDTLVRA